MTHLAAAVPMADPPRTGAREIGLWVAAAILIVGAHVAIAYAVQSFSLANEMDGGPPPVVAIELLPMMVAPAVPEDTMADVVTPEPTNQVEETVADAKPVVEPDVDKPEPVTEEAEEVQPNETTPVETAAEQPDQPPPLDEVVPDIVPTVAPELVIPLPQAKPVEDKAVEKAKKVVEKPKPKPKKEKKEKAAPAKAVVTASVDAKPAAKASAPRTSQSSARSGNSNRWKSQLGAWIKRRTHYPSAARPRRAVGTARVVFVLNASGRVTSARLAGSSGDADLDRAALSALQGATAPTPPADQVGTSIVAPLVFTLRD
ncbi:energy transducer TonB [Mesorhizobium sp. WSM4303]|uniref:energy transducer TonB family protein n=1 Tax=unclassified Mesorhizobium TaxID=325217 RepID=UPI00115E1A4E|nr:MULTISPECIES: energy transducer TonB [unclassified Mesorhizobium]TRC85226.1 energy transducer TonB [Mesorhizobium sp. WSM4306]TRC93222.1 energy transducer TonB [Mesorhizobium sp. WSM4303]